MHKELHYIVILLLTFLVIGCSNDVKEVDALLDGLSDDREIAKKVEILYSDSSIVRVRIQAPTLVRYLDKLKPREEFPDGIYVEFLNPKQQVYSWLEADYAIREMNKKEIITRKNVILRNRKNEKILSSELIWDESQEILYTEKFVRIIQPDSRDTTEGFGFVSNQEFTKFEIKKRSSASLNAERLREELDN